MLRWGAGTVLWLAALIAVGGSVHAADLPCSNTDPAPTRALVDSGRFLLAESSARELLCAAEARWGPDSAEAADAIDLLVASLVMVGKTSQPETQELADRSVRIHEALFGPDDVRIAASLQNLGMVQNLGAGDRDCSYALLRRALALRESALGPDHPDVATSLALPVEAARTAGDRPRAQALAERVHDIRLRSYGPEHPLTAFSVSWLAWLAYFAGQYPEAESLFRQSLDVLERTAGPDSYFTFDAMQGYASVLQRRGDLDAALALRERSIPVAEAATGPASQSLGVALVNLGYTALAAGDPVRALAPTRRSLEIFRAAFSPEHPFVAIATRLLAEELSESGDVPGAKVMAEEALRLHERAFGPDHPETATALETVASVSVWQGKLGAARPLKERALAIREKTEGPGHSNYAGCLLGYGWLLTELGELDAGRATIERAAALLDQLLGPDHLTSVDAHLKLAHNLRLAGRGAEALAITEDYLPRLQRVGSRMDYLTALIEKAALLKDLGDFPGALDCTLDAEQIRREQVSLFASALPERQALAVSGNIRGPDRTLTILLRDPNPERVALVWDTFVHARALVLDQFAARHRMASRPMDPATASLAAQLVAARETLARMTVRGPGADTPEQYAVRLEAARGEKERIESALAGSDAAGEVALEAPHLRIGYEDVARALPPDAALVAYAVYDPQALEPIPWAVGGTMGQIPWQLVAFVLASGAPPVVVPLGPAARIDPLVAGVARASGGQTARGADYGAGRRGSLPRRGRTTPPHRVGSGREIPRRGEAHLRRAGRTVALRQRRRPADVGRPLPRRDGTADPLPVDRARPGAGGALGLGSSTLIAFGGADFDRAPTGTEEVVRLAQAAVPTLIAPASTSVYRGPRSACESFRSLKFEALPASRTEVDQVAALWSSDARSTRSALELTGPTAHEALFKELAPKNRIVHLATHGFFLEPKCLEAGASASPLLSSGLALAGANHRDDAGPDEEDGILTAEEIASLDLTGVDWVVLSACSTGVGQPTNGEGVLGLRRAFEMAGAGTLIMSLWPVQDEASRAWMRALYEARLNGSTTADAVRQASLRTLEERRRAGLSTHPFYWGAFVAAGEWR